MLTNIYMDGGGGSAVSYNEPVTASGEEPATLTESSVYETTSEGGSGVEVPTATPTITLEATVSEWTVIVSVKVRDPDGTVRAAAAGEVEVQIADTDEATGITVYNTTAWRKTDSAGKVTFTTSEYSWIAGWTNPLYSNRFRITARFVDYPDIAVGKDLWLGLTAWSDPPEEQVQTGMSIWERESW